jgi:hypothetical protein
MADMTPVRLILPAEPASVRLARLVAAGVAADAGLSIDDTEDLRIAVSELVALLVEGPTEPGRSAEISYRRSPGRVEVSGECHCTPPAGSEPPVDDLVLEILRVVVDDHGFVTDNGVRRFHLVKRARAER